MDLPTAHSQMINSLEATLALTRELLARSRATLDAVNERLAGSVEPDAAPSSDSPRSEPPVRRHSIREST